MLIQFDILFLKRSMFNKSIFSYIIIKIRLRYVKAVPPVWFNVISVLSWMFADTVMCYQCGDSQSYGDCVTDFTGMTDTFVKYNLTGPNMTESDVRNTKYLKNCDGLDGYGPWGYGNYCIIQEVRYLGKYIFTFNSKHFISLEWCSSKMLSHS